MTACAGRVAVALLVAVPVLVVVACTRPTPALRIERLSTTPVPAVAGSQGGDRTGATTASPSPRQDPQLNSVAAPLLQAHTHLTEFEQLVDAAPLGDVLWTWTQLAPELDRQLQRFVDQPWPPQLDQANQEQVLRYATTLTEAVVAWNRVMAALQTYLRQGTVNGLWQKPDVVHAYDQATALMTILDQLRTTVLTPQPH